MRLRPIHVHPAKSRLVADERGSVIPLFALMLFVVVGIGGLAMDFARAERVRTRLAQAADAANLAAARAAASQQETDPAASKQEIMAVAEEIGRTTFQSNIAGLTGIDIKKLDLKVAYDGGFWTSRAKYSIIDGTTLSRAMGRPTLTLDGGSEASIAPGFPVLDIAMCVDSTGSMQATLDTVKANAVNFYDLLNAELAAKGIQSFPLVRVRMLYFKDFGDVTPGLWDPDPLVTSNFFALPGDSGNFNAFVSPQMAGGGADWPESGLECLNEAMDSPWMRPGDRPSGFTERVTDVYPLIIVWQDSSSHMPGYANSLANPDYPTAGKMPQTPAGMLAKWESGAVIDQSNKQILFFGDPLQGTEGNPDDGGWNDVAKWPKFVHGGTVEEANAAPLQIITEGIAKSAKGLRLTN